MKARQPKLGQSRTGGGGGSRKTSAGWKGHPQIAGFANPRMPSVPTTLDITLEEYFAAGALMGLLASQHQEPDRDWACSWSFTMGRGMAAEALRRRRRRRRRKSA